MYELLARTQHLLVGLRHLALQRAQRRVALQFGDPPVVACPIDRGTLGQSPEDRDREPRREVITPVVAELAAERGVERTVVEAHEEVGRVAAAYRNRRVVFSLCDGVFESHLLHVVGCLLRFGVLFEGVGQYLSVGGRTGRGADGDLGDDLRTAARRIVHRFAERDFGQREIVLLLREQKIVRGALRFDLRHVGGAFQPQFVEFAALVQIGGARLPLFACQPDAFGVVHHVEVGLHGVQRRFVAGLLQLLDAHEPHDTCRPHGVYSRQSCENGNLPRQAVRVVEIGDGGVGIGFGVDRTAETGRGAGGCADRGNQCGDRCDMLLAVVAVRIDLLPDVGIVFDGVGHAGVECHCGDGVCGRTGECRRSVRRGRFRSCDRIGSRRRFGCGDPLSGDGGCQ